MTSIQKPIPAEIHAFFKTACGKSPFSEQANKGIAYRAEGSSISIRPDSYGGCHIDVEGQFSPPQLQKVRAAIEALTASFRKTGAFDSVWINRPLPTDVRSLGSLAPESFCIGMQGKSDLVYDYKEGKARLWQWINERKECTIPSGPCYKMGATALVLDRTARKALLVVNERRPDAWNLPGGGYDPFKDSSTSDTALREAQEEGGFVIEDKERSESILVGQMQFPFNQFAPSLNQIWAYFLDGVSKKELHPPKGEIREAKWVPFKDIEESNGTWEGLKLGDEIKSTLRAALSGLGFRRIGNKKQMILHAPAR